MAKFSIDHSQVIGQVLQMRRLADDLEGHAKQLNQITSELDAVWDGPASAVYLEKIRQLHIATSKAVTKMNAVAGTIERVANKIRDVDKASARQFHR